MSAAHIIKVIQIVWCTWKLHDYNKTIWYLSLIGLKIASDGGEDFQPSQTFCYRHCVGETV